MKKEQLDDYELLPVGDTFAKVDKSDARFLKAWTWRLTRNGYAVTTVTYSQSLRLKVYMHRLITACISDEMRIDHINRDKLDNRRINLRYATATQNAANRGALQEKFGDVKFKGVFQNKNAATCSARIVVGQKHIYLGSSYSQAEAAKMYDAAARIAQGEFAVLNFPDEPCDQDVTSKVRATLERHGIR